MKLLKKVDIIKILVIGIDPRSNSNAINLHFYIITISEFASKHSEAKFDDVTKSQTTKCYNYTFKHSDNPAHEFILIDTPGLSDTNGVKQDDKNIQEIIDTAISAGSLSAIVIIANGTEARVTPSIKSTLVILANNLSDDLIDRNLLLILTKCTKSSASFSEDAFTKEIAKPKVSMSFITFLINYAFRYITTFIAFFILRKFFTWTTKLSVLILKSGKMMKMNVLMFNLIGISLLERLIIY